MHYYSKTFCDLPDRTDGQARLIELVRLLEAHRSAGSELADRILRDADLAATFWLVEPIVVLVPAADVTLSQPDRNPSAAVSPPTVAEGVPTLDR